MIHFKDLLKEMKFSSSFNVVIDTVGEVVNFTSEFGNETLDDIQKLVRVLISHGGITVNGTTRELVINIDDIGEDDYPYYIDVYHDLENGIQDDDSVIPFTQELINEIYTEFSI